MIRNTLILILSILLGICSYLLYKDEYIVVNIETGSRVLSDGIVQGGTSDNSSATESERMSLSEA